MKAVFSGLFDLNRYDFLKSLIMTVLGAVYGVIAGSIKAGNFTFNWDEIWKTALAAFVIYIGKQFFTPAPDTVVVDRSKTDIEFKK